MAENMSSNQSKSQEDGLDDKLAPLTHIAPVHPPETFRSALSNSIESVELNPTSVGLQHDSGNQPRKYLDDFHIDLDQMEFGEKVNMNLLLRKALELVIGTEKQVNTLQETLDTVQNDYQDRISRYEGTIAQQQTVINEMNIKVNRYQYVFQEILTTLNQTFDRLSRRGPINAAKTVEVFNQNKKPIFASLRRKASLIRQPSKMNAEELTLKLRDAAENAQTDETSSELTEQPSAKLFLIDEQDVNQLLVSLKYMRHVTRKREEENPPKESSDVISDQTSSRRPSATSVLLGKQIEDAVQERAVQSESDLAQMHTMVPTTQTVINVSVDIPKRKEDKKTFFTDLEQDIKPPISDTPQGSENEVTNVTKKIIIPFPLSLESKLENEIFPEASCRNCSAFLHRQEQLLDELTHHKRGIEFLAEQILYESVHYQEVEKAKDKLEHELEELTAQLFEQANRMVAEEAATRYRLEQTNKSLHGRLEEMMSAFGTREAELGELKRKLEKLDTIKKKSSSLSSVEPDASLQILSPRVPHTTQLAGSLVNLVSQIRLGSQTNLRANSTTNLIDRKFQKPTSPRPDGGNDSPIRVLQRKSLANAFRPTLSASLTNIEAADDKHFKGPRLVLPKPSRLNTQKVKIYVDSFVFHEFQEFLQQTQHAPKWLAIPDLFTLSNTTKFLKRCMIEDVQPCLAMMTGWMMAKKGPFLWKQRKPLIDSLLAGRLNITPISMVELHQFYKEKQTTILDMEAQSKHCILTKCQSCHVVRECEYKMRLEEEEDGRRSPQVSNIASAAHSFLVNQLGAVTGSHDRLYETEARVKTPRPETTISDSVKAFANTKTVNNSEWMYIDRFCRDRIVSVCDFFNYMSHLRSGIVKVTRLPISAPSKRSSTIPVSPDTPSKDLKSLNTSMDELHSSQLLLSEGPRTPVIRTLRSALASSQDSDELQESEPPTPQLQKQPSEPNKIITTKPVYRRSFSEATAVLGKPGSYQPDISIREAGTSGEESISPAEYGENIHDTKNNTMNSQFEVFKNCMIYRRRMGLARIGTMHMFDNDPGFVPSSNVNGGAGTLLGKQTLTNVEILLID